MNHCFLHKLVIITLATLSLVGWGSLSTAAGQSPYAGQEHRAIKTLSSEDVDDLLNGRGWGLAKAAELNGVPGPLHVLELQDQLGLSAEQVVRIEAVRAEMTSKAIPLGKQLVERESVLNERFGRRAITSASLKELLADISRTYAELRFVHLEAHLKTLEVLSDDQVSAYNRVRGYDLEDPCSEVPEGHDPQMWRRHNGCSD